MFERHFAILLITRNFSMQGPTGDSHFKFCETRASYNEILCAKPQSNGYT